MNSFNPDKLWLEDFARGAAFLGAGGGGDPYIGRLMLQQEMEAGSSLQLVDTESIEDDALCVPVATMGATTVFTERIPNVPATIAAVQKLEEIKRRKADYIVLAEAGGINATLPLVVGAAMGLPVVDCDGMGRAFPELQMVTFSIYGVSASPVILANDIDDMVIVNGHNDKSAEDLARSVCASMGAMAQIALYPLTGRQLKACGVRGTVKLAHQIGAVIRKARTDHLDPFQELISYFNQDDIGRCVKIIFDGKVIDIRRETRRGFAVGEVVLESLDAVGKRCVVQFQNEFLQAINNGKTVALVPDIISFLDRETAEPITTDRVKYGQRIKVIATGVPSIMRTKQAIATFGPRAFGIDEEYIPLEILD